MEPRYVARYMMVGYFRSVEIDLETETDMKEFIKEVEKKKGLYKSALVYEKLSGDAVYFYSANKDNS